MLTNVTIVADYFLSKGKHASYVMKISASIQTRPVHEYIHNLVVILCDYINHCSCIWSVIFTHLCQWRFTASGNKIAPQPVKLSCTFVYMKKSPTPNHKKHKKHQHYVLSVGRGVYNGMWCIHESAAMESTASPYVFLISMINLMFQRKHRWLHTQPHCIAPWGETGMCFIS